MSKRKLSNFPKHSLHVAELDHILVSVVPDLTGFLLSFQSERPLSDFSGKCDTFVLDCLPKGVDMGSIVLEQEKCLSVTFNGCNGLHLIERLRKKVSFSVYLVETAVQSSFVGGFAAISV